MRDKLLLMILLGCLLLITSCLNHNADAVISSSNTISPTSQNTATIMPPTYTPSCTETPLPSATTILIPSITPSATSSEPAGCQKPPDDYTRIDLPYATLNMRTYAMLQYADTLYDGQIDILNAITQGSYTDAEEASFGTHSGGGAVDLSVIDISTWTVLWDEIDPLIHALRIAGFAAWLRSPDELYPGSPIHIHAIAVGDAELSYAAWLQVYSDYGYLAGMNGLPPDEGMEPTTDPHGGPIICNWMKE